MCSFAYFAKKNVPHARLEQRSNGVSSAEHRTLTWSVTLTSQCFWGPRLSDSFSPVIWKSSSFLSLPVPVHFTRQPDKQKRGGRRPELSDLMSLSQKLRPSWRRLPQILISAPFSSSPDPYPPTLRDNHIRFKGLFDIGRMDCFRQSCQFRSRAFSSSIRR